MPRHFKFIAAGLVFAAFFTSFLQAARGEEEMAKLCRTISPVIVSLSSGDKALGSGVVLENNKEYYVVTLTKVVGANVDVTASFNDGSTLKTAPFLDKSEIGITILKIVDPKRKLSAASFGAFAELQVGQKVIAVGNPIGDGLVATAGIISALHHEKDETKLYGDYIQTDAAVNPANIGGALVELSGAVIGIVVQSAQTSARPPGPGGPGGGGPGAPPAAAMSGPIGGLGYAIPIDYIKNILTGTGPGIDTVTMKEMGLANLQDVNLDIMKKFGMNEKAGAFIGTVNRDTLCYAAGLRSGDVIISYGTNTVQNAENLKSLIIKTKYDTKVTVTIIGTRNDKIVTQKYTIDVKRPASDTGASYDEDVPQGYTLQFGLTGSDEFAFILKNVLPEVYTVGGSSAIVISRDPTKPDVCYLVTSAGTAGKAQSVKIRLRVPPAEQTDSEFVDVQGEVVGVDEMRGLAVIRVSHKYAPGRWKLGDNRNADVGTKLMIVGSAVDSDGLATAGVLVSNRSYGLFSNYPGFMLTDALISGRNVGGPVVDSYGKLVGISIQKGDQGPFAGLGLVLPIEDVERAAREIIATGKVSKGYLGLDDLRELTADEVKNLNLDVKVGISAGKVVANGPASRVGFAEGMVIIRFNDQWVRNVTQFQVLVATAPLDREAKVEVIYNGNRMTLKPIIRKAD